MPPQRDWESLSPRTQRSYTGTGSNRFGWSAERVREHYESGASLKELRRQTASPTFRTSGGRSAQVIARDGVQRMDHLTKAERRLAAQHWHATKRYTETGLSNDYVGSTGRLVRGLDYFEGKEINGVELESRHGSVEFMEMRGELDQSIYDLSGVSTP